MRADREAVSTDPDYPFFPPCPHEEEPPHTEGKLAELHLYDGPLCNRACSFCCVAGSPSGWQKHFGPEELDLALSLVHPQGCIKFYGGEPSIHPNQIIQAMEHFREGGFQGSFHLYTNGILARKVLQILDAEPRIIAVLNYSILHGRGAKPLPLKALNILLSYASGRIFSGHRELNDAGVTPELSLDTETPDKGSSCPHCYPVLRSDGMVHGCPFAVEIIEDHFLLGQTRDDPRALVQNFWKHIAWQKEHVEPAAIRLGVSACQVCKDHLQTLPVPHYSTP